MTSKSDMTRLAALRAQRGGSVRPSANKEDRRYLAVPLSLTTASAPEGMTSQDVAEAKGSADLARLLLAERVTLIGQAFKSLTVDPERVTVRPASKGTGVTVNLPVPVTDGDGVTFHVNVNVTLSGKDGDALRQFAGTRSAKDGE